MCIKSNNRNYSPTPNSFHTRIGAFFVNKQKSTSITKSAALLAALLTAGLAQADNPAASPPAVDDSLTWHGITLYGIVDIGLQYDTHGAPFSDYHPAGSSNIVQKNSRQSVTGLTPSNLSQSRVGLQGKEPIGGDWSAVFKIETFFNPQSGEISDALKSMTENNGRPASQQTTNLDSSVAGQAFQTAYVGVSNKMYGTLTFGRQLTLVADGIAKYDPNAASQAFSLIGMSGTYAGGGDTQDRRLDDSAKYVVGFADIGRFGLLYKFNGSNGGANTAFQADLGLDYVGLSVDAYYSKVTDAVSASPLSTAQAADLPTLGYSLNNALSATISDNTSYSLMASYKIDDAWKVFAGYEHVKYANPNTPLTAGTFDIGGYVLAFVNNNAYVDNKILNVYWAGVKYTVLPGLDLTGAFYGYHQNAYGTGDAAGCSSNAHGTCSGTFQSFSFDAVYAFSKRFDGYVGAMYSSVKDGVANGYDMQTNNLNPTVGVRFKF
jgi:predicted porin